MTINGPPSAFTRALTSLPNARKTLLTKKLLLTSVCSSPRQSIRLCAMMSSTTPSPNHRRRYVYFVRHRSNSEDV